MGGTKTVATLAGRREATRQEIFDRIEELSSQYDKYDPDNPRAWLIYSSEVEVAEEAQKALARGTWAGREDAEKTWDKMYEKSQSRICELVAEIERLWDWLTPTAIK